MYDYYDFICNIIPSITFFTTLVTHCFCACLNVLRLGHWRVINTYVCVLFQEKIKEMFENLMQVEHPNIVKFHKYWLDMKESQARVCVFFPFSFFVHSFNTLTLALSISSQVIFITEYMSSGSLKQFLKKTKKNHKTMNVKVSLCFYCVPLVAVWGAAAQFPAYIHILHRLCRLCNTKYDVLSHLLAFSNIPYHVL